METLNQIFFQGIWGFNLLDFLILCIVLFYIYEGYILGFIMACVDLTSFVLSFIGALKLYTFIAQWLMEAFSMPLGVANAFGFFFVAFILEIGINVLLRKLVLYIPTLNPARPVSHSLQRVNHWFGIIPGLISAFIILSFLLTILVALPSSPVVKKLATE